MKGLLPPASKLESSLLPTANQLASISCTWGKVAFKFIDALPGISDSVALTPRGRACVVVCKTYADVSAATAYVAAKIPQARYLLGHALPSIKFACVHRFCH